MSTSAAMKQKESMADIIARATKTTTASKAKVEVQESDSRFASIRSNTFYAIVLGEGTLESKVEKVEAALTFDTKEATEERVKEFELFKEWLSEQREIAAKKIIKATDTDTFSTLKDTYEGMNQDFIDVEEAMAPLLEIIDGVFDVRQNGQLLDAFKAIQSEKQREADLAAAAKRREEELNAARDTVTRLNSDIAAWSTEKSWGGFGGLKADAAARIARAEEEVNATLSKITAIEAAPVGQDVPPLDHGVSAESMAAVRKLVDISSSGHKDQQELVVAKVINFIEKSKSRIGTVRAHLDKSSDQLKNLFDDNEKMLTVFSVLNDGIQGAEKKNQVLVKDLEAKPDESSIAKIQREQKKMAVDNHVKMLDASAVDTMTTTADLTSQGVRIKTMVDANLEQAQKAKTMHTQAVAGMADRYATVVQAVGTAAVAESSAIAEQKIIDSNNSMNTIAQKEALKSAMGINDTNARLNKAIEDLAGYGEVVKATTGIAKAGVVEMRQKLETLQEAAGKLHDDLKTSISVNSDVHAGTETADAATTSTNRVGAPEPSIAGFGNI